MPNFPQVGLPFSSQALQGVYTYDQDPLLPIYIVATNTTGFTMTPVQVTGAQEVTLRLTGTLGAGANIQFPTAASVIPLLVNPSIPVFTGYAYTFKIINSSAGAFTWTLTTNTGVTLNPTGTGSVTIAQNSQRVFYVIVTGSNTLSVQDVSP